ncbi:MAG TPA: 1-acyl-sn-glycerol-3-phosphate acyltransferase [Clostridiales bacterium]|nr:1-acyl-sn-glycerol-3-phosphate acyltransferase [Clostridiales bacterium]
MQILIAGSPGLEQIAPTEDWGGCGTLAFAKADPAMEGRLPLLNLYSFGKAVTYPVVRGLFSIRYEGLENIPKQGGFILACNHRSNFDPVLIAHKVPHQIHYLAKDELVRIAVVGSIIRNLGVVPIKRGTGDKQALEAAIAVLRQGGVLGIFPEGHRSPDGTPLRPHSGVALIAGQTGADVLPCAVSYGPKLGFRIPITIRYGKLIPNEELGVDISSPSTLKAATRRIMEDIVAMLDYKGPAALPEKST